MDLIQIIVLSFVTVYLVVGFLYALYLLLFSEDKISNIFVNILAGPLTLVYVAYLGLTGKKVKY